MTNRTMPVKVANSWPPPLTVYGTARSLSKDYLWGPRVPGTLSNGLLQGSLDLLVLKTLSWGPMHGYGVARWIQHVTDDAVQIEEGSLYPALHRLQRQKLLRSYWGSSANNRRAKYYEITSRGRAKLMEEATAWSGFSAAVAKCLDSLEQPEWAT